MTTTDATALDLDAIRPATDLLITQLREAVGEIKDHTHPSSGEDFYCLNLVSWLGERMGPVLRRLADEQAEVRSWKDRHAALADEFTAEVDRLRPIAEAARYSYGAGPCMDGECDHATEDTPCPLVETRHATADDAIERDELRAEVKRLRAENDQQRTELDRYRAGLDVMARKAGGRRHDQ